MKMEVKSEYMEALGHLYDGDIYDKIKKSVRKEGDETVTPFRITERLSGIDKKRCKEYLLPQIERLANTQATKKASVRFAEVLIANLLIAYRKDASGQYGIELAVRKESEVSIQSKGMRYISEYVVMNVVKWLTDNGYIEKLKSHRHYVEKKDQFGFSDGMHWEQQRSTLFRATGKLNDLLTKEPLLTQLKICTGCGDEKPISDYGKQRNGYEAECKCCRAMRRKLDRKKLKTAV